MTLRISQNELDQLLHFSTKFAEDGNNKSAKICLNKAKIYFKSNFGMDLPKEVLKPIEEIIVENERKGIKEYINKSLKEQGYFIISQLPPEKKLKAVLLLRRMKENNEIEEEWFSLPDRLGAFSSAKVAFPKGKVPEKIDDLICEDCERPYFAESTDKIIAKLGYLEEKVIKDFKPEDYGKDFDIKTLDLVGTKEGKVEFYFRKGAIPDKMEDIRCRRCQRPYLSNEDVEEIFHVATSEGIGKLNPPIYI